MPPLFALLLGFLLCGWLIHQDRADRRASSATLWIPAIWLIILGSRAVDIWLHLGQAPTIDNLAGSPVNMLVQTALMGAAFVVLLHRRLPWGALWKQNGPLLLLYLYFVMSACWSEYPLVAFRRITKDFACVLMALLLLTDRDPLLAIRLLFVRCAYVLLPLSAVIGKYYPEIGREYSLSGVQSFTGLTTQKNTLGEVLVVFGLMLAWDLIEVWRAPPAAGRRRRIAVRVGVLGVGAWLLAQSGSATALLCLGIGGLLLWGGQWLARLRHKRTLVGYALIALLIGLGLLHAQEIREHILVALGRNVTLTGRTDIWSTVLEQHHAPWFGNGFYMFWDTDAGQAVFHALQANFVTAHSGYLEIYLDGGLVGIALLGLMLLAGGGRMADRLLAGRFWGRIGLVFWVVALFYNYTESNFFRMGVLWFTLLLVIIEVDPIPDPNGEPDEADESPRVAGGVA